jgi:monothiol glutaredoxin
MNNVVFDRIREEVAENDVVVFMKGTPVFPQCGFSSVVAQVMTSLGVKFKGINVLEDPGMYENGELQQLMTEKGVQTQAA